MTKAKLQKMQNFAHENSLKFDYQAKAIFGKYRDFDICITETEQGAITVSTSLTGRNGVATKKELKPIRKTIKQISMITVRDGGEVHFTIGYNYGMGGGYKKLAEVLFNITDYLRQNGFANICIVCEQIKPVSQYVVNGFGANFCDECYTNYNSQAKVQEQVMEQKDENIVFGIVGALLGSLVGLASIVIIGQLGYVAAISGLIMGVCTLKAYEKFAGKLSRIGIVISILIMAVMVVIGNRLDWTIAIIRQTGENILDVFLIIPEYIEYLEAQSDYNRNVLMIGAFTLLGCGKSIMQAFKNPTNKNNVKKLQQNANIEL